MIQPPGFEDPLYPNYVCKLDKALYGLKHAPRAWYDKLRSYLLELQFKRSDSDVSLFYRNKHESLLLLLVYVDDILITRDSHTQILKGITDLNNRFALKHPGFVHYFLGMLLILLKLQPFLSLSPNTS